MILWLILHVLHDFFDSSFLSVFPEFIYCNIKHTEYWYRCDGYPRQFYLCMTYISVILFMVYFTCSVFNLIWILKPNLRQRALSSAMEKIKEEFGLQDTDSTTDLHDLYFNNTDIKLLLDLYASTSGIAPGLRLLGLFDNEFGKLMKVRDLKVVTEVKNNDNDGDDQIDAIVTFKDAAFIKESIVKKLSANYVHSVEVSPKISSVRQHNLFKICLFSQNVMLPGILLCTSTNKSPAKNVRAGKWIQS